MFLLLSLALAHEGLEDPPPRYPSDGSTNNKACPCGVGESNRTCDDPSDWSDPDRSETVTTYAAGEVITVVWRETVGHAGRWRIAFDNDGADMEDFNDHILLDMEDPAGNTGNVGEGNLWEATVTLPDTPCDNCTLQLVQVMDGNTTDPVPDPAGRSSYYQCADIVIEGDGPTDTATLAEPTGPTGPTDETEDTGAPTPSAPADGKGCGCASGRRPVAPWAALGLLPARRRR